MSEALAAPRPRESAAHRVLVLDDPAAADTALVLQSLNLEFPSAQSTVVEDCVALHDALHRQGPWSLVLSALQLRGGSGEEVLRIVREHDPQLPFIFLSASMVEEESVVDLLKAGATDYVSKQRLHRLAPAVRRALQEAGERHSRLDAQRELHEVNTVFARVIESLQEYAVILLDAGGCATSWNQGAVQMFGHAAPEALGRRLDLLLEGEPLGIDFDGLLHKARTDGRVEREGWVFRKSGEPAWIECLLTPLFDPDGAALRGYCHIARDTTARYEDQQRLRQAKIAADRAREESERANAAKDRFMAVLSHELRNPLTAISVAAQLLSNVAKVPQRYADLVPKIRRSVALETRLVDDLLDLSDISSGKLRLRLAPIDVNDCVRDVVEDMREQIDAKGMRLKVALCAQPATVRADPVRIRQVVLALLRNAHKFSETGGSIELRSNIDGQRYRLECVDKGIGIDPEALDRIFDAFEQADSSVTKRYGGLGLGLSVSRLLVAEHGGDLRVASEGIGRGATFTLELPLLSVEQLPAITAPATAAPRSAGPGARVLLVEDNMDAAPLMIMALEDYGYRVRHAGSVGAALALADEHPFDVVLTDLGLPDGSGVEIGRALSPRLPVVALSGYGSVADMQRTMRAGFSGHLIKPADPEEIHRTLERVLEARTPSAAPVPPTS
ncbi:response regulator [Variovorax dokdonensis]|uniref:histidine kinase n=1 Tax=Variovorax dokdonensis TaxID=344883 RepID=A0ABT7NDE5_9BURK|nr:response regulator [Variovorax dokdonensis]MDM0045971.1 response regulator [Variovorax dokdonensis]